MGIGCPQPTREYGFSNCFQSFLRLLWLSQLTNSSIRSIAGDSWGNKEGSYTLRVGDGRERVVKYGPILFRSSLWLVWSSLLTNSSIRLIRYTADGSGFRASIKTNEPGIVASNPAAVNINTAGGYSSGYSHQAPVYTTHVGGYSSQGGYGGDSGKFCFPRRFDAQSQRSDCCSDCLGES